jgi:hypothetical protein
MTVTAMTVTAMTVTTRTVTTMSDLSGGQLTGGRRGGGAPGSGQPAEARVRRDASPFRDDEDSVSDRIWRHRAHRQRKASIWTRCSRLVYSISRKIFAIRSIEKRLCVPSGLTAVCASRC